MHLKIEVTAFFVLFWESIIYKRDIKDVTKMTLGSSVTQAYLALLALGYKPNKKLSKTTRSKK